MMLLFSPCKRCPCPGSDAVLRSCEEALAGIILHRPPSLWFAWVRSGCAGPLAGGPEARGRGPEGGGIPLGRGGGGVVCGGPAPETIYTCVCMYVYIYIYGVCIYIYIYSICSIQHMLYGLNMYIWFEYVHIYICIDTYTYNIERVCVCVWHMFACMHA